MSRDTTRAVVVHETDLVTHHLSAMVSGAAQGSQWRGRTSCGLVGDLTMVGALTAVYAEPTVSAQDLCEACLLRETDKPPGAGAD